MCPPHSFLFYGKFSHKKCSEHLIDFVDFLFFGVIIMELNLLTVINADGGKLNIDEELDFSAEKEYGVIFLSSVKISGEIVNMGGTLELDARVETKLGLKCDRCCEDFDYDMAFDMHELMKKAEYPESDAAEISDIHVIEGSTVDLTALVSDNIFMNLPAKRLCKPDCEGLCPQCGLNLNFGKCDCAEKTTDPRFDILDKFFDC